jgi:hypothetical protein
MKMGGSTQCYFFFIITLKIVDKYGSQKLILFDHSKLISIVLANLSDLLFFNGFTSDSGKAFRPNK